MAVNFKLIVLLFIIVITLQSCVFLLTTTIGNSSKHSSEKWKDAPYKICVQERKDYAGPSFYRYKVKRNIAGSGFYRRIYKSSISGQAYFNCKVDFYKKDTMTIDFCHKKVYKK